MEKIITYFGQKVKVACDEKCNKAWGINCRPFVQLNDDKDDILWLADNELGEAPEDPGSYEAGHAKPTCKNEIPNKWCVRECERIIITDLDKPIKLENFNIRHYNSKDFIRIPVKFK